MTEKTVKELCEAGYPEQGEGPGKQKSITFQLKGEQLMADTRPLLASLDDPFKHDLTPEKLTEMVTALDT